MSSNQHPINPEIYIAISPEGGIKMGTCDHCVLKEQGRPDRAWDNDGDRELDFPRDPLHEELARRFGIKFVNRQEYVCP